MARDLIQDCTWPGVAGVLSCQYVCSHGSSPGRAVLVTLPQWAEPAEYGNLTFFDGLRDRVTVRGCKVVSMTPQTSQAGTTYTLEILDERWQWQNLGGITGHYNAKDERGKLVPWSIRSPMELAKICFDALGITNGFATLPAGLASVAGLNLDRYLKQGENYPQSLTNPEVVWEHTPPGEALAQLGELFGCRVIYQPCKARVLLQPIGKGAPFPDYPYETIGATIEGPATPAFVGVFGAPVKIQSRFLLEAVGEDWNGAILPINQLSYTPVQNRIVKQLSQIRFLGADASTLLVYLKFDDPAGNATINMRVTDLPLPSSVAARYAAIKAKLVANPRVAALFDIDFDGATKLVFTAKQAFPFTLLAASGASDECTFQAENVTQFQNANVGCWDFENPRAFQNVQATDRLSYQEAKALALANIWKKYRIVNRDPHDLHPGPNNPGRPLKLPWFGAVKRRQQIVLQPTKVAQVMPQARIPGAINKGQIIDPKDIDALRKIGQLPGNGVLPEFYNGYSRDQKATVTGSVAAMIQNVNWLFMLKDPDKNNEQFNTESGERVYLDFSFNEMEQFIEFGEPVYYFVGGAGGAALVREPVLTLETGCYVLDEKTNQPKRWEELLAIPGGIAPVEWIHREDVQVGVVGKYAEQNKLIGFDFADLADAKNRAGYYLRGQLQKYQIKGGETRVYIGIVPHDPDGYCQQVGWSVGEAGPSTTVGGNTEYHFAVPPYPARRRAEALPADKAAAAANRAERDLLMQAVPAEAK